MATNLTTKGQVAIPKQVRDHLRLKAGAPATFQRLDSGEIPIRAAKVTTKVRASKFAKLRGRATLRMNTEDILALTRGD